MTTSGTTVRGTRICSAQVLTAAGHPPKSISEFVGRASTGDADLSIAVMRSPAGWTEPVQRPEFEEHSAVLEGVLIVHVDGARHEVPAGQSVTVPAGTEVRYETTEAAVYVSVCRPAFAPDLVHREEPGTTSPDS